MRVLLGDLPGRIRCLTVTALPLALAGCETTGPPYHFEAQCFFDGTCGASRPVNPSSSTEERLRSLRAKGMRRRRS
jgi:hypothetical protein